MDFAVGWHVAYMLQPITATPAARDNKVTASTVYKRTLEALTWRLSCLRGQLTLTYRLSTSGRLGDSAYCVGVPGGVPQGSPSQGLEFRPTMRMHTENIRDNQRAARQHLMSGNVREQTIATFVFPVWR